MNSKTLILFTNTFPYSKGEEFLETEILFLADSFKQIVIYPFNQEGEKRKLPDNVTVKTTAFSNDLSSKNIILKHWIQIVHVLKYELLFSKYRMVFFKNIKHHFNILIWNLHNALVLKQELDNYNSTEIKLYSYWFNNWGRLLSLLHLISFKKLEFVTRVHGYDYDPTRKKEGFIPFRNFEMHQVSKIFSISNYGIKTIKIEYPFFNKIKLSRLGVRNFGDNSLNVSNQFHIVSCSSLIELKRVHLIVDILKHINFPIKWTHFGDGELMDEVVASAKLLQKNITCDFKGFKPNSSVIDFYRNEPVDLFINVSSIEGIPVSIMEAISFGIPCIGTNVGGVAEIVNEQTGFLIDKNFDPKDVAEIVSKYLSKLPHEKNEFRLGVKLFWKENYNAEYNYKKFIDALN